MRATLYISLALALTGCSWFSRKAAESARPVLEEAAASAVKEAVRPPAPASKPAPDTLGLWRFDGAAGTTTFVNSVAGAVPLSGVASGARLAALQPGGIGGG